MVLYNDGIYVSAKVVISNATRWDTFEKMIKDDELPRSEIMFRKRYKKAPSFLTMHLGIKKEVLPSSNSMNHISGYIECLFRLLLSSYCA